MAGLERLVWPAIIAHRGASLEFPENTLLAFEGAIAAGADLVELDVRLTADGVPVVLHDPDVSSTTNGHGLIHQLFLAEVKKLNAPHGQPRHTGIPTLREALELFRGRVAVELEIKNIPGEASFDPSQEAIAREVVWLLDEISFSDPVLVSSFNPATLEHVRQLAPALPTGLLSSRETDPQGALAYVLEKGHRFLLPDAEAVSRGGEAFVREAHLQGVLVGTWTVDDPGEIYRLFRLGIDAVESNDPRGAISVRERARADALLSRSRIAQLAAPEDPFPDPSTGNSH
jgi:glycerophosphoryl diester phosphodiesterase